MLRTEDRRQLTYGFGVRHARKAIEAISEVSAVEQLMLECKWWVDILVREVCRGRRGEGPRGAERA